MWTDGDGMMGWSGLWSWIMSVHGILSIVSLIVIVVVGTALYRDWRRERADGMDINKLGRE